MLETSKNTLEELEIRQLKNRRGVCKRKLTVFNKFIERIDSSALTAEIIVDISLRLEQLPKLYNDFSEIQDRIETLCSDEGDIEAHEAERMSFEDTFYRLSAKGKLLAKVDTDSTPNDHSPQAPPQQPFGESIKYPEISLPSFDGDLTQWLQFRDTFDALVNQASLAPIVKYKYLRSCLQDGALEVISSLDFSEDAYMLAWQMLCERYNNPKRLVTNHMRALFDVEPVPSTPSGLRGLESANFLAALRRFIARRGKPKELDFWRRWSRDYIGTLQERTKWRSARGPSLAVDTVVLVRDERLPPCRWRLGKIVATQPGRDGVTRVAVIRTARGDIQRAFNNICPLPTSGEVI
ncbi:uncharacterized protein LOC134740471 isoform X6 [Cydia strobilella]|uniref:uncharacterized protein LOC134740471 isoform X6 n=1 Tax=Cydia strobilella TaxID=1100964 RepID=UPI0030055669